MGREYDSAAKAPMTRRQLLGRAGTGFGLVGLASNLGPKLAGAASVDPGVNPLAPKPPHFPAKAKHVIFLLMNGGVSHVDTFDPKPALDKYDGQPLPGGNPKTERKTGNLMRSPFQFRQYGKSGLPVSDVFPHVAQCIDDICVVRSVYTDIPNHEPSLLMLACGHIQPGRPSWGSWTTYGLGTENQNLPGFIVLCADIPNVVGPPMWNSSFLPAVYQGSFISTKETDPFKQIPYIRNDYATTTQQRHDLDLLAKLNRLHLERQKERDSQLEATIQSMEIAFRMQTEAPDVFDLSKESESTRQAYGNGQFARGCLIARRLVERGVRCVQLYFDKGNPWDHHNDIQQHVKLAWLCDQPIAALLKDLKQRGLLEETLVVFGTEFGRTPMVETGTFGFQVTPVQNGRDHNPFGFTVWLAGGGVKGGTAYGATDEFGLKAVENPMHIHDLHATILRAMGLDHERLTYHYSGRDFRLTDVAGKVAQDIFA
jgi:hypothetical protein